MDDDEILKNVDRINHSTIVIAFRKLVRKYEQLRNSVIVAIIIIALGAAGGLVEMNHISSARHQDAVHNTIVLCKLVNKSLQAGHYKPTGDKVLDKLLVSSEQKAKSFKSYADKLLGSSNCNNLH